MSLRITVRAAAIAVACGTFAVCAQGAPAGELGKGAEPVTTALEGRRTVGDNADAPFELHDGERVVLLGNTCFEREQRYGYWEAALTRRFPDRQVTFRNLGWSGDTVYAESRGGFGTPEDGFQQMIAQITELKPTLILLGYGSNAAFDGEAGLARFVSGLDRLLKALEPTGARVVFVSPTAHEDVGRPLPDPTGHNANVAAVCETLKSAARERGARFVDLFTPSLEAYDLSAALLTDNGMHLTEFGYWRTAPVLESALAWKPADWHVRISEQGQVQSDEGAETNGVERNAGSLRFESRRDLLPLPVAPRHASADDPRNAAVGQSTLQVLGLPEEERFELKIDGRPIVTATGGEWGRGVTILAGPDYDQADALRDAILRKNLLYFYHWRPQNMTYLFGFRKHEQGNNAVEIAEFEPLVQAMETKIAELRAPESHRYELAPAE